MTRVRHLLWAAVLVTSFAGCDSADDLVPIADAMLVGLTDERLLQVATESYDLCGVPIYVDSQSGPSTLDVYVRGAARVNASCDALVRGTWAVALPAGLPTEIRVHHRGATDLYEVRSANAGLDLVAVRTSTTQLEARPERDSL